jgi:hypothetical protein
LLDETRKSELPVGMERASMLWFDRLIETNFTVIGDLLINKLQGGVAA